MVLVPTIRVRLWIGIWTLRIKHLIFLRIFLGNFFGPFFGPFLGPVFFLIFFGT